MPDTIDGPARPDRRRHHHRPHRHAGASAACPARINRSSQLTKIPAPSLGQLPASVGLVAMATLLGYAAGLFFLVPMADLAENRALILRMLLTAALAAGVAAFAPTIASLLIVLFILGAACSAIQILVPIAASMAPPGEAGRVIGDVMSGLMIGILLARPLASLVADAWGWRALTASAAPHSSCSPACSPSPCRPRRPQAKSSYGALIASLFGLLRDEPVLRRRALTAALVMAAFSLFWTAVASAPSRTALLGLWAERGIDALRGRRTPAVPAAPAAAHAPSMADGLPAGLLSGGAMALAAWAGSFLSGATWQPLVLMGASAVLLDIGVTGDQTLGRRAVNLLQPEARGRLNGLFVGIFCSAGPGMHGGEVPQRLQGQPRLRQPLGGGFGLVALLVDWIGGRG